MRRTLPFIQQPLTRPYRAISAATSIICAMMIAKAAADGPKIRATVPLSAASWSANMHQYGYRDQDNTLQRIRSTFYLTDTSFLKDDEVVETFVTRELVEGLQTRDDPNRALPYKLHALIFDSSSGQMRRQLVWSSDYVDSGVVPRLDGSFAVFLGDHLEFFSADLEHKGTLKLTSSSGRKDLRGFSSSPSGKTILIGYGDKKPYFCVTVVNEAIKSQEKCDLPPGTAISDEEVAAFSGKRGADGQVFVKTFKGPWRPLCDWGCDEPEFVSESMLIIWSDKGLTLIQNDAKGILAVGEDVVRDWMFVRAYCPNAGLLAIPIFEPADDDKRPSTRPFSGVLVYDVSIGPPTPKLPGSPGKPPPEVILQVKNGGKNRIHNLLGLSISPRGDRLALEGDGILRCYNLPPREK